MSWRVYGVDADIHKGKYKYKVIGGFKTREEAEAWKRREDPHSQISVGIEEERPHQKDVQVIGPYPTEKGRELQRRRERRELAEQAREKIREGKTISIPERDALQRLTRENIPSTAEINRAIRESKGEITVTTEKLEQMKREEAQKRVAELTEKIKPQMRFVDVTYTPIEREKPMKFVSETFTGEGLPYYEKEQFLLQGEKPREYTPTPEGFIGATPEKDIWKEQFAERYTPEKLFGKVEERISLGGYIPPTERIKELQAVKYGREVISPKTKLQYAKGIFFAEAVPRAVETLPYALGFMGLTVLSPIAAKGVAIASIPFVVKGLQEEIAKKGLVRTGIIEIPSFAIFGWAAKAGAKLGERSAFNIEALYKRIKFERKIKMPVGEAWDVPTIALKPIKETYYAEKIKGFRTFPKPLVEMEKIQVGEPVFDISGAIIERQLPIFRDRPTPPEFAPQAEFAPPRISEAKIPSIPKEFIGKYVERPLSPAEQAMARDPLVIRKKIIERQMGLEEFPSISLERPPKPELAPTHPLYPAWLRMFKGKKGQIGLMPPIQIPKPFEKFERFGGEFFEKIPKPPTIITRIEPFARIGREISPFPLFMPPRIEIIQRQEAIQRQKALQRQKAMLMPRIKLMAELEPIATLEPVVKVEPIVSLEPVVKTKDIMAFEPLMEQPLTKPEPITTFEPFKEKPKPKAKPMLRTIPSDLLGLLGKPKKAYSVFVREGERKQDKFVKVASALPRNRALNKGARIVDETTAATFRIKPTKKQTQKIDDPFFELVGKFRKPTGRTKLPPESFVEKNKHRIDTMGELMGIPFKAKALREQKPILDVF